MNLLDPTAPLTPCQITQHECEHMTSKASKDPSDPRKRSRISEDLVIEGDLESRGIVEFGGVINGNVTADTLVVTQTGQLNGGVQAAHVEIKGQLTGTVHAQNVTINPAATVAADINYDRLSVASGAAVQGNWKSGAPRTQTG